MGLSAFWYLILWCLIGLSNGLLYAQTPALIVDVERGRIRAAYWGIKNIVYAEEQLRRLRASGFNSALIKDGGFPIREYLWQGWGDQSRQQKIRLFPVINFAGQSERSALQAVYRPYVNRHGETLPGTPCPLDVEYWNASIGQRFEQLAHLSKRTGIAGVIFDTEMYGGEIAIYGDVCLCDVCWQRFFQTTQHALTKLKPEYRFDYLGEHHLVEQYTLSQEKQLQELVSPIEQRIHAIQPSLALGVMAYNSSWFYQGLLCGLGTAANPLNVFSEISYLQGYTPHIEQQQRALTAVPCPACSQEKQGMCQPSAAYVSGLWLGRFFPDDVPSQLYNLATNTAGYWLFTAESLWAEEPLAEPYALHGNPEDYWNAFKIANDELQAFSQAPASYQTNLEPVYQASFYDDGCKQLLTQASLTTFMHHVASWYSNSEQRTTSQRSKPITFRGRVLLHSFKTPDTTPLHADNITKQTNEPSGKIRITHVQLATYTDITHYTLFDSEGRILMQGRLDASHKVVELSLMPEFSGLLSLLVDSGANASQVQFFGLPSVLEASTTFPMATNSTIRSYKLYVPPEQSKITIRGYCSTGEAASLSFRSLQNQEIQRYTVIDFTDIRFPVPPAQSMNSSVQEEVHLETSAFAKNNLWEVTVNPVEDTIFDDVQFHLYNHEFPYLIIEEE